ncbi:hypothetical protein ONZ45_g7599 [Pleurotus djamor]|nr:hypothetical protein ONZ45_g7599 [Pleurotus djamor]
MAGKYAKLSVVARFSLLLQLLKLPGLSIPQVQKITGTTLSTYRAIISKLHLQPVEEEIKENARLLWIGPKRTDRVLLYLHGGAFHFPMSPSAAQFWRYVQQRLKDGPNGFDLGIAVLNYGLIPEAAYPTPLRQAVAAIQHLMAEGVQPENLHLAGDSAGGNLILQVLSHALHPLESVEPLRFFEHVRGVYLISPWVSLNAQGGSHIQHANSDVIEPRRVHAWSQNLLADVPDSQRPYVEPSAAPEDWYAGIDKVVDRILITAGGQECLRDDIVEFEGKLKKHHSDLCLVVQKGGVHNEVFMDFFAKEPKLGDATPLVIDWLASGYGVSS